MSRRKRLLLISLLFSSFLIALPCWLVYRQYRQASMDQALIAAIKARNTERALQLLEAGADGNAHVTGEVLSFRQMLLQFLNRLRRTPDSPVVRMGPVKLGEEYHQSALLLLYNVNTGLLPGPDPILVRSLLDHGARIDEYDANGCSPLYLASEHDESDTVCLLLECGANPNKADSGGGTPLMRANAAITQILLDHGAHIDAQDGQGETALMSAAHYLEETDNVKVVRILLDHGADVQIRNIEGLTVLDIVKSHKSPNTRKVLALLKEYGAK